jgi:hypothetical protein
LTRFREDGITNGFYSQFPDICIPFFSRLFSIIGSAHSFPPTFSAGVITSIYKRGPLALPSSYRPITLLNTDYRLLARIIAARLSRALSTVIHPSHTAFLKGRHIGDNISMLQLLPNALRCTCQTFLLALKSRKLRKRLDRQERDDTWTG